jgi:serine protease Do
VRKAAYLLLATALPAAGAPLPSRRSEIVEVVDRVSPSVVNISAQQTVRRNRSLFDDFFFGMDNRPVRSLGSGVIIDAKGIILTNDHVISGASKIIATTKDGRELECDVVGSDADNDLAVLKARGAVSGLPTIKMGTSSDLLIGETVVAIGNPFGLSNTVTAGVLSAMGRSVPGENKRVYNDFLQIDAPINPGNSGGPVVNIQGELVGIATAIIGGGAQGIGFAIPVDRAQRIMSDLLRFGRVQPVWIGIHGRTIGAQDEGRPKGFRVRSVEPASPAERAGIKAGDQIVSIDDKPIDSQEAFETALSTRGPGRPMKMTVRTGPASRTVTISGQAPPADYGVRLLREELGMTLRGARRGLRITIADAEGAAARAGLESGDTLLALNGEEVNSVEDVNNVLKRDHSRTTLWMVVGRGSWQYTLTFPLS